MGMSTGVGFDERLLKPKDCADRLGIGMRTFFRWVSAGELPPPDLRRGAKVVRWKLSTVNRWIEENATAAK